MKLLFDQNLPLRLVNSLSDLYPNSAHVMGLELDRALDQEIRCYALQNDFAIVTKDADFGELNLVFGFPPKVIWIRRENCSTKDVEDLLRENRNLIESLGEDPKSGALMLF